MAATDPGTGATKKRKKRQKPPSQLQRLAEKVQAEKVGTLGAYTRLLHFLVS